MNKAKLITIQTKKQVLSEVVGNNPSLFKGEGYDFSEIREYAPGEDIRKIDWMVTAKLQKPYVKLFFEQRQLNIATVAVMGGSMFFGSKFLKQDLVAKLAAIIGFSSVYNNDTYAHYTYSPRCNNYKPPTKNPRYIDSVVSQILEQSLLGTNINLEDVCEDVAKTIKKKSIVFFIGDFVDAELHLHVLAKKHEVIALIVRDELEENPEKIGKLKTMDPSTLKASSMVDAKNYSKALYENDQKLYKYFRKHRIKFDKFYTHKDPIKKLTKLFYS